MLEDSLEESTDVEPVEPVETPSPTPAELAFLQQLFSDAAIGFSLVEKEVADYGKTHQEP